MKEIEKNLDLEDKITDSIAYFALAGASSMSNFRSPDAFVFIFFEKADGWHTVDFTEFKTMDNQIHISFPGQIHSWDTKQGAKGHKLILPKTYVERLLHTTQFSDPEVNHFPVLDLSKEIVTQLNQDFIALRDEINRDQRSVNLINLRIQIILTLLGELLEGKEKGAEQTHPVLTKYLNLIDKNFVNERSVSFYAGEIGVSANYLNILSRKYLTISAKKCIDLRTVLEAKRLLLGTDKTIKEIAYELNFRELSAFTGFISRNTGSSPSDYRSKEFNLFER